MTSKRLTYIFTILLAGLLTTSCMDDALYEDANPVGNPNAVSFAAFVSGESLPATRADEAQKTIYNPLELRGDNSDLTLYLHTYDSEIIGHDELVPASTSASSPATRGVQVESVDYLLSSNTSFMVRAAYKDDASEYIAWTRGKQLGSDKSIWITDRTQYWPGQRDLAFHAVYPYEEVSAMTNAAISPNYYRFSYTAKKGTANKDAELQQDLMLATSVCNKETSIDGRAPLKFNHALSAIKFAVRDVLNGEVVNIKIRGVYGSGDCVYSADDSGDNGRFEWSNLSSKQEYSQNFNYTISGRSATNPQDNSNDLVLNDKMPEKTFMLIPQQLTDDAEIEVTIKRTGLAPGAQESITVKAKINSNQLGEWLPGHEYIYTISTTKDNWVYVFSATGNHNMSTGQHNVDGNQIFVYAPNKKAFDTYGENAYFKVTSYRYRANDQTVKEAIPWTASHGGARGYKNPDGKIEDAGDRYAIDAATWIQDIKGLKGEGSTTAERHDLTFANHYSMTTWKGDEWMQVQTQRGTQASPWDLSTAGGSLSRTTANSYVIDRGGWYMFPIVYGNMIENGKYNESAIKFKGTKLSSLSVSQSVYTLTYRYLNTFTDYAGNAISSSDGYIPTGQYKSAHMLWSDVYNGIDNVEIITVSGKKYIRFYVPSENIQQGNTVIGISSTDKATAGKIVWSWHIWFTEHWLNPSSGKSNAFEENTSVFTNYNAAMGQSGMRERGDVQTSKNLGISGYKYHISPYNVGWCDPKMVDYLQRPGTMKFVQERSGKVIEIPILQQGERIDYKYGNNVYYQFGRKDPFIGFVDHDNNVKRSFGPLQYEKAAQPKAIKAGIANPNVLYCTGTGTNVLSNLTPLNDWLSGNTYVNLWNNAGTFIMGMTGNNTNSWKNKALFVNTKTVYDPCPPGYMVPPAAVWKITGGDINGKYDDISFSNTKLPSHVTQEVVNGDTRYILYAASSQTNKNKLWFTGTGHRWYADDKSDKVKGGDNFNPHLAYLWSSMSSGRIDRSALGLALGKDGSGYGVCSFFFGRRSMARPVRAVRQNYTAP